MKWLNLILASLALVGVVVLGYGMKANLERIDDNVKLGWFRMGTTEDELRKLRRNYERDSKWREPKKVERHGGVEI